MVFRFVASNFFMELNGVSITLDRVDEHIWAYNSHGCFHGKVLSN